MKEGEPRRVSGEPVPGGLPKQNFTEIKPTNEARRSQADKDSYGAIMELAEEERRGK